MMKWGDEGIEVGNERDEGSEVNEGGEGDEGYEEVKAFNLS